MKWPRRVRAAQPDADSLPQINKEIAGIDRLRTEVKKESRDLKILQEKYRRYRWRMRIDDALTASVILIVYTAAFLGLAPLAPFIALVIAGIVAIMLLRAHKKQNKKTMDATIGAMEARSEALRRRVRDATSKRH